MNKVINLIIAGIIGASSIAGINAAAPQQQPAVRTEYIYIETEPETVIEYVYIDASDNELEEAFNEGYQQGTSDGYGDGYNAGYKDCMNDFS